MLDMTVQRMSHDIVWVQSVAETCLPVRQFVCGFWKMSYLNIRSKI